jgi:type II pantothenate kinase
MMEAINYLASTAITENIRTIGCTGGGGHKYAKQFAEQLEIKVVPLDELGCLVRGMDFTLTNVANECYTYRQRQLDGTTSSSNTNDEKRWQKDVKEDMQIVILPKEIFVSKDIFPYLIVNIGSGVSILKVTSPGKFERVSGSSLGGGTYWGLCRLLTGCDSYEKVLDLAESGNAAEVDMLVKDIYGGSYDQMNLNASMVASSFGKLVMKTNPREGVKEEDLAIALLMMITNNIGQVAYLNAQLHNCSKIFFVGSFLRHNSISCRRLAFAIDFWSAGKMEALFLKHEGYFGALGTFLQSAFENDLDSILDLGHADGEEQSRMSAADSTSSILNMNHRAVYRDGASLSSGKLKKKLRADSAVIDTSSTSPSASSLSAKKRYRSFSNDAAAKSSISTSADTSSSPSYLDTWRQLQHQSLDWVRANRQSEHLKEPSTES